MIKKPLFLLFLLFISFSSFAQVAGDFRSIVTGDWNDLNTWEVYDGVGWAYATELEILPTENNAVYIQENTTVSLSDKAFSKDLHIHENAHLALVADTIEVWGKLNFFSSAFPANNIKLPEGDSGSWISSGEEGVLLFRGSSRTIITPNSGGTSNGLAGYNMVVAFEEGEEAIISENFRTGNLRVTSGALKVTTDSLFLGNKSSLSGNMTIGDSTHFYPPTKGIFRTDTSPIATFTLESLSTMLISHTNVVFASSQVDIQGTVIVEEAAGQDIRLPSNGEIAGAAPIDTYTHLVLKGTSDKFLSSNLTLNGILTKPAVVFGNEAGDSYAISYGPNGGLEYVNVHDDTDDFLFPETNGPAHLIINNSGISLHENRTIQGKLTLKNDGILYLWDNKHFTLGADSPPIEGDFSLNNFIALEGNGSLRKIFDAPGSFYFPIGETEFTPAEITVNSGNFSTSNYLSVNVKGEKYAYDNSVNHIKRHWIINSTLGNLNIDGVFHYDGNDAMGNEASIMAYIYGNAREEPLSLADAVNKTLSFNDVSTNLEEFYITGSNRCNVIDDWITVVAGDYCGSVDLDLIEGSDAITGDPENNIYVWQQQFNKGGWNNISGASQRDYDPELLTAPGLYEFRRVVSTLGCATRHMSNVFAFTLYPEVENFDIEDADTKEFCLIGTEFEIIGDLPTGGDGDFSYQWERSKNGGDFESVGDDTKDYQEADELTPGVYSYKRSLFSTTCGTFESNVVLVKVYDEIKDYSITSAITQYCGITSEVVLKSSVASGPKGGSGRYTYTWERRKVGEVDFQTVGNTKDFTDHNIPELGKYEYRRIVKDDICGEKTSSAITLQFLPELSNNIIDTEELIFCSTSSGFRIEGSTITGGDGIYAYSWERSKNGGSFTVILNNVDSTNYFQNNPLDPGEYLYRRIAKSASCRNISEEKSVIVLPPITGNELVALAENEYCGVAQTIYLEASTPEGGNGTYTYDWQRRKDEGTFVSVGNAASFQEAELNVPGKYEYRRLVSSGACQPVSSDTVAITVYPELSENLLTSTADYCTSVSGIAIEGSTMTGGDGAYTYTWERNINGEGFLPVLGDQKDFTEIETLTPGEYQYRRTVTSAVCNSVSETLTINVYPPIAGNTLIEPETSFCGASTGFTITGAIPEGGSGTFQYRYERKVDNGPWEAIGGNTANLTEAALSTPGVYYYRRLVSSASCDEVTSNTITIFVSEPITVSGTVTATNNNEKTGAITLEVAGGTPPYSYIWSGGQDTKDVANLDAAEHTVKVLDAFNCETSVTFTVPRILGLKDSPYVESYKLYPNPVSETLYIEASFLKTLTSEVYIINSVGQVIKDLKTIPSNKLSLEVDMQSYPAGIYFVKVMINGKVETWKFIKQ